MLLIRVCAFSSSNKSRSSPTILAGIYSIEFFYCSCDYDDISVYEFRVYTHLESYPFVGILVCEFH